MAKRRRRRIRTNKFIDAVLERRSMFRQVEQTAARSLIRVLDEVRVDIITSIVASLEQSADPTTGSLVDNANNRRRLRERLREVDRAIERGVAETTQELEARRLAAFRTGVLDATFEAEQVGQSIGTSFGQMFDEALRLSQSQPVLGVSPRTALRGTQLQLESIIRKEVGRGIANGQGVAETAARIREATDITQSAAMRVARTNLNAAYNDAHRMTYEANPDVYKGYRWDATFDNRTSVICASLHGTFYPLGSKPPGPPAHPNCRSTLIGVFADPVAEAAATGPKRVRTFDENGEISGSELIDSQTSFDKWLRTQPDSVVQRVAGSPVKASLLRSGKVGMRDIVGDDLIERSDVEVLQRALARRPKDKALKAQAKELGVKRRSKKSLEIKDRRIQGAATHTIGTRRRMPRAERERIEKLDERKKKKTRDRVRAGAARVAKEAGTI